MTELDTLVGEWTVAMRFVDESLPDMHGRTTFEWMVGEKFLIQRSGADHPAMPSAHSLIGYDEGRGTLLQHYFDSRGVARVYEMTLAGGEWTLSRTKPDFSELGFWQRFSGRVSDEQIVGAWEASRDEGATWDKDFDLTYTRVN
jgi:hypothetical protein